MWHLGREYKTGMGGWSVVILYHSACNASHSGFV